VNVWLEKPETLSGQGDFLHAGAVRQTLKRQLVDRLDGKDRQALIQLQQGDWDRLGTRPWIFEPTERLCIWLATRALVGLEEVHSRKKVLSKVLPLTPNWAWRLYLTRRDGLDPEEVCQWIQAHGALDAELAGHIENILVNVDQYPRWLEGGGATLIHEMQRGGVPDRTLAFERYCHDHELIIRLFAMAKTAGNAKPNEALRKLKGLISGANGKIYFSWIVDAVIYSEGSEESLALAEVAEDKITERVGNFIERRALGGDFGSFLISLRLWDSGREKWNMVGGRSLEKLCKDRTKIKIRQQLEQTLQFHADIGLRAAWDNYQASIRNANVLHRSVDAIKSIIKPKRV
jgi:hypothetical protein